MYIQRSNKQGLRVKGMYYYCESCMKQIDYYEWLRYDGKCMYCYF